MFKIFKKVVLLILINSMLIITCFGCGSVSSNVAKPNNKFSAYSDDKAFYVYGEISSTNLKKDKSFTVTAHLKNMTNYGYNLAYGNDVILINFRKADETFTTSAIETFKKIDANGIIDVKLSFTPKEKGNYILSLNAEFSAYNVSTKSSHDYNIKFDDKHFLVE